MKKTITAIIIVFIAGLVLGQTIGAIITQQQFDNIDFQTRSLEIEIYSKAKKESTIEITISYLTLAKQEGARWMVIQKRRTIVYPLEDYHQCRVAEQTKSYCIQQAKQTIIGEVKELKSNVRTRLELSKTMAYVDEITVEDINISIEELNEE